MARQARIEYSGALHHVMSRGNDGMMIFRDDEDRKLFLVLLGEEVRRCRWVLQDFTLMGNHYHLIVTTQECTLSMGMHRLLGRYAQRFNRKYGRRGHLFQDRFKSVLIEKEVYGLEVSRYLALNPVRAGLCERPEQWRWSSYAARIGQAEAPAWLSIEPLMSQLGSTIQQQRKAYQEFVNAKVPKVFDPVEQALGQIYLGTTSWIDRIQALLDESERSEELQRAHVHPGRPALDDVLAAVASMFDTTSERIQTSHGTLERRLVAYIAFEEGLVPLRAIGRALGLRSPGGVSHLLRRCRDDLAGDTATVDLVAAIRKCVRRGPPPAFFLPERVIPTARNYHRAVARSRRAP
jgi:putative transposase